MGCTTCKKKKPVTKLDPVIDEPVVMFTKEQTILAYQLLGGIKEDEKLFVNNVYKSIFNESFDWGCKACVNTQVRKFKAHIEKQFNVKL